MMKWLRARWVRKAAANGGWVNGALGPHPDATGSRAAVPGRYGLAARADGLRQGGLVQRAQPSPCEVTRHYGYCSTHNCWEG